jgi:hypothetical protein
MEVLQVIEPLAMEAALEAAEQPLECPRPHPPIVIHFTGWECGHSGLRVRKSYKRECQETFSPPAGRRGYFWASTPRAVSSTDVDRRGPVAPAAGHRVAIRCGFMLVIVTTPFVSQN